MSARALLKRFDIVADRSANIPSIRRLVVDLAVRGKLLRTEELDVDVQEMLRRISSKADELALSGAIKKLKPLSKIDNDEVPAAYLAHGTFARLGNIANLQKGLTGIQSSMPGEFPLVATTAERGTCDHFDFDGAAAIIPLVSSTGHGNASINRLHYQDGKFALGTILCAVFPFDEQLVSARFLYEYLRAFKEELLVSKMIGTANVTLTLGKIAEVPVPILAPAVQKRVDELMALCDQLEAAQQEREHRRDRLAAASLQRLNQPAADTTPEAQREHARFHLHHLPRLTTRPEHIKAMRQTIFNLAICGRLVAQDADDEPVRKLLKRLGVQVAKSQADANSPIIPAAWAWVTIDQIANVSSGTTPSRDVSEYYLPDGTPWVTSGETRNAFITTTAQHVSDRALKDTSLKLYPPGTLIVAMYGQGKTRGQVTELSIAATTNQACAAIVLKLENVGHRRYVKLFFQKIYEEIRELAAGGAQPNLNGGKIKLTLIPLPPLSEQHRIVAKVDQLMALCDQLEAQLTTTQTDSHRLLEAVLDATLVK